MPLLTSPDAIGITDEYIYDGSEKYKGRPSSFIADFEKSIAEAHAAAKPLTVIRIYGCDIGKDGVKAIAKAIKANQLLQLRILHLTHQSIGDSNMLTLANAIEGMLLPNLVEINFCENWHLTSDGIVALIQALEKNTRSTLEEIDLSDTYLCDRGAMALAKAIENARFPELKKINFNHTYVETKGAIAIAKAIENGGTPKLECLSLRFTRINEEGYQALAKAIKSQRNIWQFDFNLMRINNESTICAILTALYNNHFIRKLNELRTQVEAAIQDLPSQENKIYISSQKLAEFNNELDKLELDSNPYNEEQVKEIFNLKLLLAQYTSPKIGMFTQPTLWITRQGTLENGKKCFYPVPAAFNRNFDFENDAPQKSKKGTQLEVDPHESVVFNSYGNASL